MGTKHSEVFAALCAPFPAGEVRQRPGSGGRPLVYITATTVADRLDEVLGPEGWDFEIQPWGLDALIGTLIIRLPDGTTVRKSNVGGKAEMQAADDDAKSAASDCLKRCANLVGIGRHLYRDTLPDPSHRPAHADDGRREVNEQFRPQPGREPDRPQGERKTYDGPPRSGKALFAWVRGQEQQRDIEILKHLNAYAKGQNLPPRMVDYTPEDVEVVYAEALRKLESLA